MAVLWNPQSDVRDYLSIIEGDPGLTAAVLRAANSSFTAPTGPTYTASDALEKIGADGAKQIVTAAFARSESEDMPRSDLHVEDFWAWQLAVALLTECFAVIDQRPQAEIDAAFTAGLLHQVGRLSLVARNPDRYREVVNLVNTGVAPLEAEWRTLGDDSAHLTAQVAMHWGFFEPLPATLAALASPKVSGLSRLLLEARKVARLIGLSEGYSLTVPVQTPLPNDHPRFEALAAIGGVSGLMRQVEWFHHASGGRTPLSSRPTDRDATEQLAG